MKTGIHRPEFRIAIVSRDFTSSKPGPDSPVFLLLQCNSQQHSVLIVFHLSYKYSIAFFIPKNETFGLIIE